MAILRRGTRSLFLLLIAACFACSCSRPAWAIAPSTLQDYSAHLESLRTLLIVCRANPAACDPQKAGGDEEVALPALNAGANVDRFEAHYGWLRDTLRQAHDPAMKDRDRVLAEASARLDEAMQDAKRAAAGQTSGPSDFTRARSDANAILNHSEFVTVTSDSIWDRVLANLYLLLDRLFGSMASFGKRSPWIGPLLEWGLIAVALTGLVLWAMRVLHRQRMKVRIEASRQIEPWEEASRNWRAQAAEQAAQQNWREAVHCIYWASIVVLEGRRFWTPNRARTPREYVRLLEAGSPRWSLLRRQTQGFERIWYGLNPAAPADYESALELHEQLRTA
jgi:hypothetical protein